MSEILSPTSTIHIGGALDKLEGVAPGIKKYLPAPKNYASDDAVHRQILEEICPVLDFCRSNRSELEDEWVAIRNMEMQIHDENRRYLGRSEAYFPLWSRILATRSSALAKGLFPSDEYLDCVEQNGKSTEAARNAKAYTQWELEKNGRIRTNVKPFLRQLESLGNTVLKHTYQQNERYEGRSVKRNIVGSIGGVEPRFEKMLYDGIYLSTRSMFTWYAYPLTADNIEECTLVFEDIDMPMAKIEEMSKRTIAPWVNIELALNSTKPPGHEAKQYDLMAAYNAASGMEADTTVGRVRTIQEVWTYLVLPRDAYMDDEDHTCPVPVVIHMTSDWWPLCVMRNPYYHQRPPYRFQRYNTHPGMLYGYGTGRLVRHLQYQANDFLNQTNDCGNYILNPIIKRNPAMMAGPFRSIRPGVTWDVTDVDKAVKFERPPFELVREGLNMVAMFLNYGQDFSGAPPILAGMGKGSTATGDQLRQRNAMSPIQDQVEEIEQETFVPLLHSIWKNGQQFRDKKTMFAIAGQSYEMDPVAFAIDAQFRMLASSQAVNSQQRAQQAIQFVSQMVPLMEPLMQLGYVVDPVPVLRRVYSDGLGFRGFDEFIRKAVSQPGQPIRPDQVNGVMQQQGNNIRSALEQLSGQGSVEMADGEGEAFADVRDGADEMAAQQGSTYGQG